MCRLSINCHSFHCLGGSAFSKCTVTLTESMFLKPSNRTRIVYGEIKHSDMYLDHYHDNGIPVHVIEIHLHMLYDEPILGLKLCLFFLPFSWTTASVLQTMK